MHQTGFGSCLVLNSKTKLRMYVFFDLKLLSDTQKDVSISESMIGNICLAIPFESLYVVLDMEWKELDSDLNFTYYYK